MLGFMGAISRQQLSGAVESEIKATICIGRVSMQPDYTLPLLGFRSTVSFGLQAPALS